MRQQLTVEKQKEKIENPTVREVLEKNLKAKQKAHGPEGGTI